MVACVIVCSLGIMSGLPFCELGWDGNTDPSTGRGTFKYQMMPIQLLKLPEPLANKVVHRCVDPV